MDKTIKINYKKIGNYFLKLLSAPGKRLKERSKQKAEVIFSIEKFKEWESHKAPQDLFKSIRPELKASESASPSYSGSVSPSYSEEVSGSVSPSPEIETRGFDSLANELFDDIHKLHKDTDEIFDDLIDGVNDIIKTLKKRKRK